MALGIGGLSPPHWAAFHAPPRRLNIWDGSVRSAKTTTSLLKERELVRIAPEGGPLLYVGKTERTLYRNIIMPMQEIFGTKHIRYTVGSAEGRIFGRKMVAVGANDERAESKIRGMTAAHILGDELSLWPESFWNMALSRMSLAGANLLGTTNPDSPNHFLRQKFLARVDELDLDHRHFTLHDNPHLPPEFVAELEKEYTGLWRKRFIDGLWVLAEGVVYQQLDEDLHQVEELPELLETWGGGDYGTANPTVFLKLSLGVDGCMYVHDEWRWDSRQKARQMTDAEYSAAFREWAAAEAGTRRPTRFYLDPSAASFSLQLWRDGVQGVIPADNDVLSGIRNVSSLLSKGKLKFHRATTMGVWNELSGYAWDDKAQKKGEDRPMKVDDHGPDALRYAVRGTRQVWRPWVTAVLEEEENR
jgi:PBSX family phage terminase large subunit